MQKIEFEILGKLKAKERHRFNSRTQVIYTPNTTHEQEQWIGWICRKSMKNTKPFAKDVPLALRMTVYCKKLICRPDVDNQAKLIMDALNGVAYVDDSQIAFLQTKRVISVTAKTQIIITQCNEDE